MLIRYFFFLVIIAAGVSHCCAQAPFLSAMDEEEQEMGTRWGISAGAQLNQHSANFQQLPGVPNCCPRFENGSGVGPSLGAFLEFPINLHMSFDVGASYVTSNATLTADEPVTVNLNNTAGDGLFRHTVDATLSSVGLNALAAYRLFGNLSLNVGGRIGYTIAKSYHQQEQIIQPAGGTFADGTRIRNDLSGTIPGATAINASLVGGLRYVISLNDKKTLRLAPEVSYDYALTGVASDLSWKANAMAFGISLMFAPPPPTPVAPPGEMYLPPLERQSPPVPVAFRIPVEIDWYGPSCAIEAVPLDDGNHEHAGETIRVEEFESTQMLPMLRYVFFEEKAVSLPDRYTVQKFDQATEFTWDEGKYYQDKELIRAHHDLLYIVAQRLAGKPNAVLHITGCTSGVNAEKDDLGLATRRAKKVRDLILYFAKEIKPENVRVDARKLPEHATLPDHLDDPRAQEENRRVELSSDDPDILAPIQSRKAIMYSVDPPALRLYLTANSFHGKGIKDWTVNVGQMGSPLWTKKGSGTPPPTVSWRMDSIQKFVPSNASDIEFNMSIVDGAGADEFVPHDAAGGSQSYAYPAKHISVADKRSAHHTDVTRDMYRLVLLNYNEAGWDAETERMLKDIRQNIHPTSKIEVTGYCDKIGDEAYNLQLSKRRAQEVAASLGHPDAKTRGLGSTSPLFDNNFPEGRMLNRMVEVQVTTPVEGK